MVFVLALSACGSSAAVTGAPWREADVLFARGDPRWLGSDGAYSIDLGGERILWLFGDTFVATTPRNVRTEAKMVRNTVAIEEGRDPLTARFSPSWRTQADGSPASFFAEEGARWHWPAHGVRLPGGPLMVFLAIVQATPGMGLGFATAGWRAVIVDDPDQPPERWQPRRLDPAPQSFSAQVGTAVALDGDFVVALAASDKGEHPTYLARFPRAALARGDLASLAWWTGQGWTPAAETHAPPPAVIPSGATEASLHFDGGRWIYVVSRGFGATRVAVRTAPRPEGPWSNPIDLYTPPESLEPSPFVYAAKAHPELAAAGLVITYATNSFRFADLLDPARERTLYWPRFATLTLPR
jgi:hypothetical protein